MRDEQIASIAHYWHNLAHKSQQQRDPRRAVIETAHEDITALVAEVERLWVIDKQQSEWIDQLMEEQTRYASKNAVLTTENAAMREIVQAVAKDSWYTHSSTLGGTLVQSCICVFCEEEAWPPHGSRDIPHQPDCPVTKARAILEK